ncbi:ASCH domain-containing protein [Microbacterium sp. NPDC096154]|uniref:ASCH domain-containing protein n=1 Tax=Microbacterium sp. NPDC096154 TaxID=3155549 RepID=UPI00333246E5
MSIPDPDPSILAAFWSRARTGIAHTEPGLALPHEPPSAWGFGATPQHADALLALVIDGIKTGTSSALWDYEVSGEPLPQRGQLDIVTDGSGTPRAVLLNTALEILPFRDVDAAHAHAEGEGDRSLAHWRDVHERFFTAYAGHDRGFSPDMPVVVERFRVIHC